MAEVKYPKNRINLHMMYLGWYNRHTSIVTDCAEVVALRSYINRTKQNVFEIENDLMVDIARLNKPGSVY